MQTGASLEFDEKFNNSQCGAIDKAVKQHWTGIQGPPGTGKTGLLATIVELLLRIADATSWETRNLHSLTHRCVKTGDYTMKKEDKLAIVCGSNNAADNCVSAFTKVRSGKTVLRVGTMPDDPLTAKNFWIGNLKNYNEDGSKADTAIDKAEDTARLLKNADVIVTTTASVTAGHLNGFTFWAMVIDEAGQNTKTDSVRTLLKGVHVWVLIGDHNQLPPTIKSQDARKKCPGLEVSLLQAWTEDTCDIRMSNDYVRRELLEHPKST